jgi:uncharacterized protein (TIGR03067 family)
MKLLGTLFAIVAVAGLASAEEKKFDAAKLEGKWKITEGTKNGAKVEEANLKGEVIITKDTVTIKAADMTHVMAFKLDTSKSPVQIDMEGKEGPAAGAKAEGIISVDGDTLKLAYTTNIAGSGFDGKRPTKFESDKDSKSFYFLLKKEK